jgi:hypothetical protein
MTHTTPVTFLTLAKLEKARQHIANWRQTQKPRSRIPEPFWASFVELARECGLWRTARTLGLDYNCLKKRLQSAGIVNGYTQEPASAFIELMPSQIAPFSECTVELEHPRGARMRIHLKTGSVPDLATLSGTFWKNAQ